METVNFNLGQLLQTITVVMLTINGWILKAIWAQIQKNEKILINHISDHTIHQIKTA